MIIINGSARSDSDTKKTINLVLDGKQADIINLHEKNIAHYDYDGSYPKNDEFLEIIEQILQHEVIILASPVYWYTISGQLKVFFDRFTDLITIKKQLGRALEGKQVYLISCGADKKIPEEFEKPIKATCQYLQMQYKGCFYYGVDSTDDIFNGKQISAAKQFGANI